MKKDLSLKDIKPGQTVRVINILGEGTLRKRLIDMGITPGVKIFVRKIAPLGDPIEVNLRGYELSLRKDIAKNILVNKNIIN
ncbi:MAG: ferrous iron transport protein A [Oscillospiraceae bacterium]|nr:ferrous iron transport protein A [Oscillospiraceae bacterium]